MKDRLELMVRSLKGLWVGDCIGNIGQLYFAHDILKALDEGIIKFGVDKINPMAQQFQYSDDTEEAVVLVNHLAENNSIDQDKLAMEFAKRYFERDPDGEIYGYGLMTRKVLREIYEGTPWRVANQTKPRIEGPSFVDNMLAGVASGKSINQAMSEVNAKLKEKAKTEPQLKIGSCGNGAAMRVAPLGAYLSNNPFTILLNNAELQAEVTHCHPEGIAGSIAVSVLTGEIALTYQLMLDGKPNPIETPQYYYKTVINWTPFGQVRDGIKKASELPLDTPIGKLIEILGNGTHVTCQDTVPLCVFLTIRALTQYKVEEMYEKVLIETCQCFGDVDTNCAIVGGMIGIISPPPEKWVRYCQPMEGVLGDPLPENKRNPIPQTFDKFVVKEVLKETRPWGTGNGMVEDQAASILETEKALASALRKPAPTFEEVLAARKKELQIN